MHTASGSTRVWWTTSTYYVVPCSTTGGTRTTTSSSTELHSIETLETLPEVILIP